MVDEAEGGGGLVDEAEGGGGVMDVNTTTSPHKDSVLSSTSLSQSVIFAPGWNLPYLVPEVVSPSQFIAYLYISDPSIVVCRMELVLKQ